VVVAYLWCYPSICLEGLRKLTETSVEIARFPGEIQIEYIQNQNLDRYRYTNLLGVLWEVGSYVLNRKLNKQTVNLFL
jgi:hypothetical protein